MPTREAAVSRPSDQAGPTSTSWPRARNSLTVASAHAALDDQHAGPRGARPERNREMLGMPGRRVDRFLQVHTGVDVAQEELRRPLVLLVAAGRAPGEIGFAVAQRHRRRSASCADACPARARPDDLRRARTCCARVPRQKPSSGITGEDCSQPPDGVDETMLPARVDDIEMHGVAAHRAVARVARPDGAVVCRHASRAADGRLARLPRPRAPATRTQLLAETLRSCRGAVRARPCR